MAHPISLRLYRWFIRNTREIMLMECTRVDSWWQSRICLSKAQICWTSKTHVLVAGLLPSPTSTSFGNYSIFSFTCGSWSSNLLNTLSRNFSLFHLGSTVITNGSITSSSSISFQLLWRSSIRMEAIPRQLANQRRHTSRGIC